MFLSKNSQFHQNSACSPLIRPTYKNRSLAMVKLSMKLSKVKEGSYTFLTNTRMAGDSVIATGSGFGFHHHSPKLRRRRPWLRENGTVFYSASHERTVVRDKVHRSASANTRHCFSHSHYLSRPLSLAVASMSVTSVTVPYFSFYVLVPQFVQTPQLYFLRSIFVPSSLC